MVLNDAILLLENAERILTVLGVLEDIVLFIKHTSPYKHPSSDSKRMVLPDKNRLDVFQDLLSFGLRLQLLLPRDEQNTVRKRGRPRKTFHLAKNPSAPNNGNSVSKPI